MHGGLPLATGGVGSMGVHGDHVRRMDDRDGQLRSVVADGCLQLLFHDGLLADEDDVEAIGAMPPGGQHGAAHDLTGGMVAAHRIERYTHLSPTYLSQVPGHDDS